MFYYLEGRMTLLDPPVAVIDCGGVGYACNITLKTQAKLTAGERARLYTHLLVREDLFEIYGFYDREELSAFRRLIGVTGVGTRAALSILSTLTPERLALSVLSDDEGALTQSPGIGKKLAQRIILELKDKLKKQYKGMPSSGADTEGIGAAPADSVSEALMALGVLGYSAAEASAALRGTDTQGMSAEDLIRHALKQLARP